MNTPLNFSNTEPTKYAILAVEHYAAAMLENTDMLCELHNDLYEISELFRGYENMVFLQTTPDKGQILFSVEEDAPAADINKKWQLTESIKNILVKLAAFFDKFFIYIGGVLLLNTKAVNAAVAELESVLSNSAYTSKLKESYDIKTIPIDNIIQLITKAKAMLTSEEKRANTIKSFSKDSDVERLATFKADMAGEQTAFKEAAEACSTGWFTKNPTASASLNGWTDLAKVQALGVSCKTLDGLIRQAMAMKASVLTIIKNIKNSNSNADNAMINKELLNYLKTDLAKQFTGVITALGKSCNETGKTAKKIVGLVK